MLNFVGGDFHFTTGQASSWQTRLCFVSKRSPLRKVSNGLSGGSEPQKEKQGTALDG